MRISDWSSDVCSSDLFEAHRADAGARREIRARGEAERALQRPSGRSEHKGQVAPRLVGYQPACHDEAATVVMAHRLNVALEGYDVTCSIIRIVADTLCRTGATPSCTIRRSEEHTSELQSLMRISYAVFCLKKK